jgi:hypothetical protein
MMRRRQDNKVSEGLSGAEIVLCGAGAVGSNLADTLARQGAARLRVIDFDRVEEHNVANQIYTLEDVGAFKVEALRHQLFRAAGVEIEAVPKELTDRNARKLLAGADLVIDGFDRSVSRRLVTEVCAAEGIPCLHVGLSADYAEILWNEGYRVPADPPGDVCADPLARGLVLLAVAVAAETMLRYLVDGVREGWTATLRDFAVRPA